MSILSLSSITLRKIITLSEKRETLLSEVKQVESRIRSLEASEPVGKKAVSPKPVTKGRRGHLKDAILAQLKLAGDAGVSVPEIASKLGTKPVNLYVWFSSTGKKLGIRKIAPGKYAI